MSDHPKVDISWEPSACASEYWIKFDCVNGSVEPRSSSSSNLELEKEELEDCSEPDFYVAAMRKISEKNII